ncbi:low molecular weight protein-tyrosine-phosphatase [Pseudanabaena mucicola]|uniref:Low molecular weight phosphotyrosine protein phosphatase n=1 Tax=Pseudanabaena mucicola FACHB-723 TaxID=2692860 RepID=A0ABR7ZRG1_9CYAN|nr:low molecular weight protein-tyrosine-phosphatase [Pseudanabaena mucicola]MBD2186529.1 low molecular weight phosphotyrosine protein phosphatase [Pseudanabaena mucicola FACHB-723]
MTKKLLFVCLGNICRSPAAENIMNHLLEQEGLCDRIVCDSAGTGGWHVGAPPDRRMRAAAKERGLNFVGSARQLEAMDLREFDLILAMDKDNYRNILALDPQGKFTDKVKMMCDYCQTHNDQEVPDPYYGGSDGFNYVIDLLFDACTGLLKSLK